MRVLFCSTGGAGHLQPMVPLARALLRRGHRVAWATAPDALPELEGSRVELESSRVELFPAGPDMTSARQAYRRRWPEAAVLRGEALAAHTFPRLFGAVIAPAMIEDLGAAVDRWRPDLVINEVAALAAPLVCDRRRVRHLTHAYGLRPPEALLACAMRELGPCWDAAGLRTPPDGGLYRHLYLDIAPPALQRVAAGKDARVQRLSPAAAVGSTPRPLPAALLRVLEAAARPRVYLTFGTVFNRNAVIRTAAAALARLDAIVVVTVGRDGDVDTPGGLPENVHVERWLDQNALLPYCDAVVSHAGAGTMLGAAAHGVPQLLLPQAADQFRNARAIADAGAGLVLSPDDASLEAIEAAGRTLLGSHALRVAARTLAREIETMPSADAVVTVLERD